MIITGKRHGFLGRYKVGFDNSGKLLALQLNLYSDAGWSVDLSPPGAAAGHAPCGQCLLHPQCGPEGLHGQN